VEKEPRIKIYFQQTLYRVKSRMIFHDLMSLFNSIQQMQIKDGVKIFRNSLIEQ